MENIRITNAEKIVEHIWWTRAKRFVIAENASLDALFIVRESEITIDIVCEGKNSKAAVTCIFLSKENETIIGKVNGTLAWDGASAELYLLSFLWDKANCQIDGGVIIAPDTKWTSWHLLEENIILGKKVKIKTLPMLDVRSSDVSASHGAKIDRLDEWKLFYMMARGLDQKQSQKLIIQGYINRACENVDPEMKNEIKEKVVSDILDYFAM